MTDEPMLQHPPFSAPGELDDQVPAVARVFSSLICAVVDGYRELELDVYTPGGAVRLQSKVIHSPAC